MKTTTAPARTGRVSVSTDEWQARQGGRLVGLIRASEPGIDLARPAPGYRAIRVFPDGIVDDLRDRTGAPVRYAAAASARRAISRLSPEAEFVPTCWSAWREGTLAGLVFSVDEPDAQPAHWLAALVSPGPDGHTGVGPTMTLRPVALGDAPGRSRQTFPDPDLARRELLDALAGIGGSAS